MWADATGHAAAVALTLAFAPVPLLLSALLIRGLRREASVTPGRRAAAWTIAILTIGVIVFPIAGMAGLYLLLASTPRASLFRPPRRPPPRPAAARRAATTAALPPLLPPRITPDEFRDRQRRARELAAQRGLAGILVWSRGGHTTDRFYDVQWLAGYTSQFPFIP